MIDGCDVCRSSCDDRDKLLPFPKRQFVRPSALVAMMMVRLIRLRNHQSLRRCRRTQCRRHPHPLRWPPLTSSQTRTPEHRCHRLYNKQVQKNKKQTRIAVTSQVVEFTSSLPNAQFPMAMSIPRSLPAPSTCIDLRHGKPTALPFDFVLVKTKFCLFPFLTRTHTHTHNSKQQRQKTHDRCHTLTQTSMSSGGPAAFRADT